MFIFLAYVDVLIFPRIIYFVPAVLLHCWLGVRKSIRPVKIEWWGVGVAICLERGADCLHMVQLMPLHPKTPSSPGSLKSRLVLPSGTCLPRLSWPSSSHMIYLWAASWPEYVCVFCCSECWLVTMKDILDKNTWDRPYAVLGWGSLTFAFLSSIVFFAAYGGNAWWVIYYARPDGQISTESASCGFTQWLG